MNEELKPHDFEEIPFSEVAKHLAGGATVKDSLTVQAHPVAMKDSEIIALAEAKIGSNAAKFAGHGYLIQFARALLSRAPVAAQADEDAHVIDRLGKLLAGVAIALKGQEAALQRHSYHDLPELAQKVALELEIYRATYGESAVAAQASEPEHWKSIDDSQEWPKLDGVTAFHVIERHANDWAETGRMMEAWLSARSATQPSAETVRDAALEEAANTATGFLVGDPLAGIPLRNPMTHEIAAAIRALKSAPPQPADSAQYVEALDVENHRLRHAMQKVMARLTNLLDEDQFGNIESIVEEAGVTPPQPAEQPSTSPAVLEAELIAALRWAIDEAHAQKLAGISGPLSRILARAQGEQAAPEGEEIALNIIRRWPEGFQERLEHVWKDLIGFIPTYKLYDLQRVLAEFGFTMKVYESTAPGASGDQA